MNLNLLRCLQIFFWDEKSKVTKQIINLRMKHNLKTKIISYKTPS